MMKLVKASITCHIIPKQKLILLIEQLHNFTNQNTNGNSVIIKYIENRNAYKNQPRILP